MQIYWLKLSRREHWDAFLLLNFYFNWGLKQQTTNNDRLRASKDGSHGFWNAVGNIFTILAWILVKVESIF